MSGGHAEGSRIYAELRGADRAAQMLERAQGTGAEAAVADLALEFVFGKIWSREGLDRKQRSLVTIGALIALRQTAELQNHFRIALTNGLSMAEIEEAIVQMAPYAGFPAAWSAAGVLASMTFDGTQGRDIGFD